MVKKLLTYLGSARPPPRPCSWVEGLPWPICRRAGAPDTVRESLQAATRSVKNRAAVAMLELIAGFAVRGANRASASARSPTVDWQSPTW